MARKTQIATENTIELRQRRRSRGTWDGRQWRAQDRVPRLAVVRPVARTALTPGTVVWAHIPFADDDGWKLRPAVVSHTSGREVVVFRATSAETRFRYPWAYRELADLTSAGLQRATGVHLATTTIDVVDIVSVAGELGSDDRVAVIGGEADLQLSHLAFAA